MPSVVRTFIFYFDEIQKRSQNFSKSENDEAKLVLSLQVNTKSELRKLSFSKLKIHSAMERLTLDVEDKANEAFVLLISKNQIFLRIIQQMLAGVLRKTTKSTMPLIGDKG